MQAHAFLHSILLLGTVQGFIISCLLFFTGPRHLHTRIFGWLMFLVSLNCLNQYLFDDAWIQADPLMRLLPDLVPLVLPMAFGPLVLYYTRAYTDPLFRLSKKHFIPLIIDLVPYLTAWTFIIGLLTGLVRNNPGPWGYFMDEWNHYADIPRWLSVTMYLLLAWRYKKDNRWLRNFLLGFFVFQLIWLAYLIPYTFAGVQHTFPWFPVFIPLVLLIYWMGFNGFLQSGKEKRKSSALPDQAVEEAVALLTNAMEKDKLYLNPELNLSLLVQHTGLPQKTISAVLNQHLHKSFNGYINSYRIEAFKNRVREQDTSQLTIAGIAKECGFSSQATFQRIFKQYTGMVPSAYLKNGD